MTGDDADPPGGFEPLAGAGYQVDQRVLVEPRRGDQFHAGRHLDRLRVLRNHHVGRPVIAEGGRLVDRGRIQRIVIAGQQVERDRGSRRYRIQGSHNDLATHLVRLEHIAANHDETALLLLSQRTDSSHGVDARPAEAGLGLAAEEMPGHAQLPVGGVDESDHAAEYTQGL